MEDPGGVMALVESTSRQGEKKVAEEEQILLRLAANHLFLGQFEPFRATLKTISSKNPQVAVGILRSVVSLGGRLAGVLVSKSVPSPAHLAWMCVLELQELDKQLCSIPNIELVKTVVEMLVLLEQLETEVRSRESSSFEGQEECTDSGSRLLEPGFTCDMATFYVNKLEMLLVPSATCVNYTLSDEQQRKSQAWIQAAAVAQPSVIAAICNNIRSQEELDTEAQAEPFNVLMHTQRAFLSFIRDSIEEGSLVKVLPLLQYLDERCSIPESDFSETVSLLTERCLAADDPSEQLLTVYEGILSSGCIRLLRVIEATQDAAIQNEESTSSDSLHLSAPFLKLHKQLEMLRAGGTSTSEDIVRDFTRQAFHYARVKGDHVLERATKMALDAIKENQLQLAADVLFPFPRLQPLVAAMGWDLLRGNTSGRYKMMKLLWHKKSKLGTELPSRHVQEASCIEDLCDQLCFNLEVAYFIADLKAGKDCQFTEAKLLNSVSEEELPANDFTANLVLELLAGGSPLRVIFDMIPDMKLQDAVNILKLQPVTSSLDLMHRFQDFELLHLHYALQVAAVAVLGVTAGNQNSSSWKGSLALLAQLEQHLEVIKTPTRRIWLLGIVTLFLQMDEQLLKPVSVDDGLQSRLQEAGEGLSTASKDQPEQPVLVFIRRMLELLRKHLPSPGFSLAIGPEKVERLEPGWKEAWEKERIRIEDYITDWNWRLLVIERLMLPSSEKLIWKSVSSVFHSSPLTILNMCIQNAHYDLAKDAASRYGLHLENVALLQLVEWLHGESSRKAVSLQEDLKTFIVSQSLEPISSVVLLMDVAATYAPSIEASKLLLQQASTFFSETSQEALQKKDKHMFLPVLKRVLHRFGELLEQGQLPVALSGEDLHGSDSVRQGSKQRALTMLHQIIEDAHNGKGQFLSGKLHNLMKALADEEFDDNMKPEKNGFGVGLGFQPLVEASVVEEELQQVQMPTGKRFLSPLANKPSAYLSAFILYVATIGDIVDGVDTTHDFNFFSLLYERPGDLLIQLVFRKSSMDGASKVAEIMGIDLVHQIVAACVPPVFPAKSLYFSNDDGVAEGQRPPHELDEAIVKYLSTLSPVRAVLSCVFGNKVSTLGNEFAVELAERFPTLQRWIQMQTNLQTLRDCSIFSAKTPREDTKHTKTTKLKRRREAESSDEKDKHHDHEERKQSDVDGAETSTFHARLASQQVFEDETPYQEAVDGMIKDGKLIDALAFADRWLKTGAPDKLLQLLIERGDDSVPSSSRHHNVWNSSWHYCIRLRDKRLAASLALKYLHRWELHEAVDVMTMCSCHLPADDILFEEVVRVKRNLQQYSQILQEDSQFQNWQEIESLCERDPEGLALRLAGKGAVTAALDIAESFQLSDDLRRELQGRQLVKLLTADPINGGGPAEAIRFLGSLNRPEDALPVSMAAMEQLPSLHAKQLLVHFLLKRQIGLLSEEEHARMDRLALGLKMLGALPLPWQQRCAGLHEHPQLILETLLMWKQFQAASQLLEAFPVLRNDKLIITYAAKAINVPGPATERHHLSSKAASGNKLNFNNGTHRDGRRAYAWGTRDSRNKIIPKDGGRKRKSALPPSQKAAWEAMAGYQEERPIGLGPEGYEKLTPLTMADEWVLSGDPTKDESVRSSHKYESAPSFGLFKALLSLCSDQAGAAKSAVDLAVSQVQNILSAESLRVNATSEAVERAFHAAGTFVQVLLDARTQVHKLLGSIEASSYSGEESGAAKDGGRENPPLQSLTTLLSDADVWLNRVELLHTLLGSGVTASVEDVADEDSALLLRDRLILEERYGMAVYTCTKCKIDVFPVWEAWGYALLRIEHHAQARLKFKKAMQLCRDDPAKVVQKIVDTMESCPPADVHAARSLYVHMAKSVSSSSDDSLSADSYLNVLYIPTFTRLERSKTFAEEATKLLSHFGPDEIAFPLSNLDSTRYEECKYYLDEYARPLLLAFMFRHARYNEACHLFFPVGAIPPVPASLSSGSSKLDSLATEYGSIDDLCELCVAYGAIPNLQHVIENRGSEDDQVAHHTAAALNRICLYFDNHRHFNHLYHFQVLKKDFIAAGLCCIQLFLNSSTQDQALRHLERAKAHFEEGLTARQQIIENAKSAAKVSRGKSPSEKLTDEDLIKYSARVTIQMDIVRCFSDADGAPWKRSVFGNPSDSDTFKRRCEIAETLVEKNFDLAFQIIYDFGLPAVHIYAGVAAALAERRKYNNLVELLRNIKGTIDNEDLDQIIGAAISVYANKHHERPDRLIDMLASNHRKVLACVLCGRLKSAFQIASRSNNVADVQWVAQQARMTGAVSVEDMCKQWLARTS